MTGNVSETRKVQEFSDCSFLCLRLGISSCLSFNIGKITDISGYYTCELSTSEKYLELDESFRDRISYDSFIYLFIYIFILNIRSSVKVTLFSNVMLLFQSSLKQLFTSVPVASGSGDKYFQATSTSLNSR